MALPDASGRRKHIKNNWFYKGLGVQGWQPQMPTGCGNTPKTIGFIKVWMSRVGNPRCQRAAETHQTHWLYKGLGVQDWQPQGPEGEGNTSKTICFTRVLVSRVGNPRGQRVGKEIKHHWLYKDLGVQGWQPQVPKGEGNISTTIGFIRVWVSRVCSPRCQRAAETHQKPLVL